LHAPSPEVDAIYLFGISTSDEEGEDQPRRSNKRGKEGDGEDKKSDIPAKKMRVSDSHDLRLFDAELKNISNLLVEASNLKTSFISNFTSPMADFAPKCPTPPFVIGCDNDGGDGWSGGDCDSGHGAVDGDSSAPSVGSGGGCDAVQFPSCYRLLQAPFTRSSALMLACPSCSCNPLSHAHTDPSHPISCRNTPPRNPSGADSRAASPMAMAGGEEGGDELHEEVTARLLSVSRRLQPP
jgi:hypothetical protein